MTYVHKEREKTWHDGLPAYALLCFAATVPLYGSWLLTIVTWGFVGMALSPSCGGRGR